MKRDRWQRSIERLDPDVEFVEIYRIVAGHEFPWDMTQSLGLALYRNIKDAAATDLRGPCSPSAPPPSGSSAWQAPSRRLGYGPAPA